MAGRSLAGTTWNGRTANGKVVTPGTYTATLSVSNSVISACSKSKSINFTVTEDPNTCNLKVSFGSSANLANGNLSHSQEVFSLPGSGLSTDLSLYYNSTDPYLGPLGMGWSHSYDITLTEQVSGDVLLRSGNGGYKLYQYANGAYLAPRGDYSHLARNPDNTFVLTRPDGQTSQFNGDGLLATITDRNDNAMQFDYAAGLLTRITDSAGRVTALAYDTNAKLSAITAPDGQAYRFAVIGDRLELVGAAYPGNRFWDYTYDANGFLLSKMDPNGNLTTYTYDEQFRVQTSTDPEGRVRTINYPTGEEEVLTSELVEKDGGVWRYTYDTTNGNLLEKSDPQGNTTSYTHDAAGNTLTETGPDGATTSHLYDSVGNLLATTDPAGQSTSYAYNEFGQTTSVTDAAGGVTGYEYDAQGNLLTITDPAGAATGYTYDAAGRATSITDAAGGVTRMAYDAAGNLAAITDPAGATTTMAYDAAGRLLAQTDPQGGVTTFTYDAAGNLVSTTDPLGGVTSATFDANGNRTSQTDANGNTTYYEFNAQGQVVKSVDALDQVTLFSYGGNPGCATCFGGVDKLTGLTDANGHATAFEYDSLGRLLREIDPLGNATSYAYDAKGNLTAKTDGNGAIIRYSYDILGRLVKKLYPDNSEESFSYDARGNVLTAVNASAGYVFAYDTAGWLTSITDQLDRTIRYEYDQAGRKTRMITPDGKAVNYEYDSAGRLGKIRSDGDFVFGYDQTGRRASLGYPNGVVANYTYDQGSRLTNLTHKTAGGTILAGNNYTLDKIGNRLANQTPVRTLSYQYDDLYRLTEALSSTPGNSPSSTGKGKGIPNATQQQKEFYTYDPVGNRLTSDTTPLYTYNSANQLLSNGGDYSYDKNGNLVEMITSEGVTLYAWDYENRLKQVTLPNGNIVTFKHDPMGRRVEKSATTDGVVTTIGYFYDNEDILFETDATGLIGNRYLHGPGIDEPLALVQGEKTYYYHADGLGSIVALTDYKGKLAQDYQYDSFGNLHDQMNRVKQPYTYTGREWDRETGLYYYRARYYDAQVGRFISEDPIGFEGGVNQFSYALNNPLRLIDPFGRNAGDVCTNITMKRKNIRLIGGDRYGHWWVEMGAESYGWWPKYPVSIIDTFRGVAGELNGQTSFGGTPTRDPHHGDAALETFNPKLTSDCSCNEAVKCIRSFANSYSGSWSWPWGQNCHSFQTSMMSSCNLKK